MSKPKPIIGVLALQGAVELHRPHIEAAGGVYAPVKTAEQIATADAYILPGGESTTMLKLLDAENLFGPLVEFGRKKPVFGTCAGAILVAREVLAPKQHSLDLVDLTVERNAYGRQIDSRIVTLHPEPSSGLPENVEAVFIRAPIIRRMGEGVKVLAKYGDDPVLVEHGRHLIATFHPELSADASIHRRFLAKVAEG